VIGHGDDTSFTIRGRRRDGLLQIIRESGNAAAARQGISDESEAVWQGHWRCLGRPNKLASAHLKRDENALASWVKNGESIQSAGGYCRHS
jgi:hypothetical protein